MGKATWGIPQAKLPVQNRAGSADGLRYDEEEIMAERIYLLKPAEYGVPAWIVATGLEYRAAGEEGFPRATWWLNNAEEDELFSREELMATQEGRHALAAFERGVYSDFDEHQAGELAARDNPELDRLAEFEGSVGARALIEQGYPREAVRRFIAGSLPSRAED
jgi:hypothetical protein